MQNDILKIKMFHQQSVKFMRLMLCALSSGLSVFRAFSKNSLCALRLIFVVCVKGFLCVLCGFSMGIGGAFLHFDLSF